jgi:hypothetical protein
VSDLGAVLYRAGHHQEALERLTALESRLDDPNAGTSISPAYTGYFLAMTHHALGHAAAARTWLDKADAWTEPVLENETEPSPWDRRLTLELLRDEAHVLIGPQTDGDSSIAGDDDQPPPPPVSERTGNTETRHDD